MTLLKDYDCACPLAARPAIPNALPCGPMAARCLLALKAKAAYHAQMLKKKRARPLSVWAYAFWAGS